MSKSLLNSPKPSTDPLKLTAAAVNYRARDITEGNRLLYRYRFSSNDDWATSSIKRESSASRSALGVPPQVGMASGRAGYGKR